MECISAGDGVDDIDNIDKNAMRMHKRIKIVSSANISKVNKNFFRTWNFYVSVA